MRNSFTRVIFFFPDFPGFFLGHFAVGLSHKNANLKTAKDAKEMRKGREETSAGGVLQELDVSAALFLEEVEKRGIKIGYAMQ